jgi:hypothetical protein
MRFFFIRSAKLLQSTSVEFILSEAKDRTLMLHQSTQHLVLLFHS